MSDPTDAEARRVNRVTLAIVICLALYAIGLLVFAKMMWGFGDTWATHRAYAVAAVALVVPTAMMCSLLFRDRQQFKSARTKAGAKRVFWITLLIVVAGGLAVWILRGDSTDWTSVLTPLGAASPLVVPLLITQAVPAKPKKIK